MHYLTGALLEQSAVMCSFCNVYFPGPAKTLVCRWDKNFYGFLGFLIQDHPVPLAR